MVDSNDEGTSITQLVETGRDCGPEKLVKIINEWIDSHSEPPVGIGLAIPGLVGSEGIIEASDVLPRLSGWRPKDKLDADKVVILNDAKAGLVEAVHSCPGVNNLALIQAGTGIGAALFLEGSPYYGTSGWSGELGSFPFLSTEGIQTLDQLSGGAALLSRLDMDGRSMAEQSQSGNITVNKEIKKAGHYLGMSIAGVINLINPEIVILSGGMMRLSSYLEATLEAVKSHSLPSHRNSCKVFKHPESENLIALGALRFVSQKIVEEKL